MRTGPVLTLFAVGCVLLLYGCRSTSSTAANIHLSSQRNCKVDIKAVTQEAANVITRSWEIDMEKCDLTKTSNDTTEQD